jgi:hypothetical protein
MFKVLLPSWERKKEVKELVLFCVCQLLFGLTCKVSEFCFEEKKGAKGSLGTFLGLIYGSYKP